jgi:hypothetical protein
MVKLLPIPSLKKVRITKTKIPTNKSPQDSQSQKKNLLTRHDAPERSWSNPHCYLCFGDRWSLGFVLVLPVPTGQEEKGSSSVCQKVPELQPRSYKTELFSDF